MVSLSRNPVFLRMPYQNTGVRIPQDTYFKKIPGPHPTPAKSKSLWVKPRNLYFNKFPQQRLCPWSTDCSLRNPAAAPSHHIIMPGGSMATAMNK